MVSPSLMAILQMRPCYWDANPFSMTSQTRVKLFSVLVLWKRPAATVQILQLRKFRDKLAFPYFSKQSQIWRTWSFLLGVVDLENLEMELIEFQVNSIWKKKFKELPETLEKTKGMTRDNAVTSENEIFKVWNSLPNNFNSMKALQIASLTLFRSCYACEQLLSALSYIYQYDTRSRSTNNVWAACVTLEITKYQPKIQKLSACICCNQSVGVALNVWFTTNGMFAKNNTHIHVARTSNNRVITACDLCCCLLPQCDAARAFRSQHVAT